jgi:hypothetical protein
MRGALSGLSTQTKYFDQVCMARRNRGTLSVRRRWSRALHESMLLTLKTSFFLLGSINFRALCAREGLLDEIALAILDFKDFAFDRVIRNHCVTALE